MTYSIEMRTNFTEKNFRFCEFSHDLHLVIYCNKNITANNPAWPGSSPQETKYDDESLWNLVGFTEALKKILETSISDSKK